MKISDRTEINKRLDIHSYFPEFYSALIPDIGRPQYTEQCVDAIHKYADMPFEIIVHDDGSEPAKKQLYLDRLRGKVSTLIFNMGYNTGLAKSMNRCRKMANGKYLLGFNSDVFMTSPFMYDMQWVLDKPYVGIVNVTKKIGDGPGTGYTDTGRKMCLLKGTGTCHLFGITASRWDEMGGWDENVQTTASDVGFVGSLFGKGYFVVLVEGTYTNEMWPKETVDYGAINLPGTNPDYIECGQFCRNDNNVQPIFNLGQFDHSRMCEKRREDIWHCVNDFQNEISLFPQWYNGRFQCAEIPKLFPSDKFIDWEFAKEYGHDKWKDMIIKDFNLKD